MFSPKPAWEMAVTISSEEHFEKSKTSTGPYLDLHN
jgi:hypothetical protein